MPMNPPDSRDCQKCKTDYNTIYQCERCGSIWDIPDAPVWHDAKTDPPKVGCQYMVYTRIGFWLDYRLNHEGKDIWEELRDDEVMFWMPLPEPPKESEG